MKEQILNLRNQGNSYKQIQELLGCSKSLISYYCNPNTKEVILLSKENRKNGIYVSSKYEDVLCLNCSAVVERRNKKYCSVKCSGEHKKKLKYEEYLEKESDYKGYKTSMQWIKQHLLEEQLDCCDICSTKNEWNNKKLVFILDHIDGDAGNNERSNLRLVCPNCDSQLDTYKAKNIGKSTRKYKPHLV